MLKKELDKINGDLVEVHKNSKQVIEEIYKKHLTALEKLQKVTDGKIHRLQSMQMEVQRQINQLQYGEDFLKIQMRQLEPIEYLQSYKRHVEYRKDILKQQKDGVTNMIGKSFEISVHGDIVIEEGQKNYHHNQ